MFADVNNEIPLIVEWFEVNDLSINPIKSQSIIFIRSCINLSTLPQLRVGDRLTPYSDKIRNLGLITDSRFNWNDYVKYICCRVNYGLRTLKSCAAYFSYCKN